jgi:hypothetical protein
MNNNQLEIYTPNELLVAGLRLLGWTPRQILRVNADTNITRFRAFFNAHPVPLAQLWEDLQTTTIAAANINRAGRRRSLKEFFMALNFLSRYPTEYQREGLWKVSRNTLRKSGWTYVECIGALKADKIVWPAGNYGTDQWVIAFDGVHFATEEKVHPTLPKDPSIFSYKHNCAGFVYEFGVSLSESRCIWMNGPFDAGTYNDGKIFRDEGLLAKLRSTNKRGIADGGYRGHSKYVSMPNSHDSDEVKLFKRRARQRNEKYNGVLKTFYSLGYKFRHSKARLQNCVEAVAVITAYKMEHGEPLYDI